MRHVLAPSRKEKRARKANGRRSSRVRTRIGALARALARGLADAPFGAAWLDAGLGLAWANRAFGSLTGAAAPGSLDVAFPESAARLAEVARELVPGGEVSLRVSRAGGDSPEGLDLLLTRPVAPSKGREPGGLLLLVRRVKEAIEPSQRAGAARAEKLAGRLARLQEVTAALSAAAAERQVVDATFQVGLGVMAASGGSLSFPAADGRLGAVHAFGSLMTRPKGAPESASGFALAIEEAFSSGKPVWISSAEDPREPRRNPEEPGPLPPGGAFAALPLLAGARKVGVLAIRFPEPRVFEEEERGFIVAVAQQCAQALERAHLYEAQRALAGRMERTAAERDVLVKELRRTLLERDESTALLDALFENAPVGLGLLDLEMRYLRVNAHLAALAGSPPEEHRGRRIWDVTPRMVHDELVEGFRTVVRERKPILERPITSQLKGSEDPLRTFLVSWFPVSAGGRLIAVGVLMREVTEQRRAEALQRHLLGVVGHDLRSPLMAITASAELMLSGSPGEAQTRALERILRGARRIEGIIRALVDYTLLEVGGGIPLRRRRTDLGAIARAVAEEAEAAHAGRRVRVTSCEPIPGEWDPDRVGQALANLVGNAIDYSPPESTVEVSCRVQGGEGVVRVSNQGAPIAPELVPALFEPFRRGDDERSQRRKGLGLGLYIARQIVAAHGGAIEHASAPEAWTTFTVRLPLSAAGVPAPEPGGAVSRG